MKKLLLFLFIFFVAFNFNSCNNDDDDANLDKVIGKWRLNQILYKVDQQYVNYPITECEKKMTLEIFENETFIEKDYILNDAQNDCEALTTINGTWKYLGNSMYEMSDILISGITITIEMKVIFEGHTMTANFLGTIEEDGEEIEIDMKFIFIDNDYYVPDKIIGKWQLDQEFENGIEVELSACEKSMNIQFFEYGIYEEKDFYLENTQCIPIEVKKSSWKSIGNSMYEIDDLGVSEFKITFENNKMTVEFNDTEGGETVSIKKVLIKVT